jgi:hypothetical protein
MKEAQRFTKQIGEGILLQLLDSEDEENWTVCLFVCVGPRKRVYCSLQAYCTYPMCVQCSHFHRQEAPRHNDAGDPSGER